MTLTEFAKLDKKNDRKTQFKIVKKLRSQY